MDITFHCPHCGKTVRIGREHAGKKGRCPGCAAVVDIPDAAAPLEAVASSGRPEGDIIDAFEVSTPPLSRGWTSVRTGLGLVYWGTLVNFVAGILTVGVSVGIVNLGAGMRAEKGMLALLGVCVLLGALVVLASFIIMIVGKAMCGGTPDECGGKGLAITSAVLWVLSLLLMAGVFVLAGVEGNRDRRAAEMRPPPPVAVQRPADKADFAPLAGLLFFMSAALGLAGQVCFVILLRMIAAFFQKPRLAASAIKYLVYVGVYIAAYVVLVVSLGILAKKLEWGWLIGLGAVLAILVGAIIAFLWFLDLVNKTRTTVTKALASAA